MIDYRKDLQTELSKILPTYPEIFIKKCSLPCITYRLNNNADITYNAASFGYSELSFIIKLWGTDYPTLVSYEEQLDATMHSLGFMRNSANELNYNNQIQLVYIYDAVGYENNEE